MAGNEGRTGQVPPIALTRPANTTTTSPATSRQACSLADKVVALHDFMDFVDHRFSVDYLTPLLFSSPLTRHDLSDLLL